MRAFATSLAALALVAAVAAASASAGTYNVDVCSRTGDGTGNASGILIFEDQPNTAGLTNVSSCGTDAAEPRVEQRVTGATATGVAIWQLQAAPDTKLRRVEAFRETAMPWPTAGLIWEVRDRTTQLDLVAGNVASRAVSYSLDNSFLRVILRCGIAAPCAVGAPPRSMGSLAAISATVEDNFLPQAEFRSSPRLLEPLEETVSVPILATDKGSGVRFTALLVDNQQVALAEHTNDGKCKTPFRFMAPCDTEIGSTFELDTTKLTDGPHQLRIVVDDAIEQQEQSAGFQVEVRNAPTELERPLVSGAAEVGGTLGASNGKWAGAEASFLTQWLRCPPGAKLGEETGCAPIPGATGSRYVPVAEDAGKSLVAKVVATNFAGTASQLSAPTQPVAARIVPPVLMPAMKLPPALSGVSLSPKSLKAGKRARLSFTGSEAGKLSVAVAPVGKGAARRKPAKPLATVTAAVAAGPGSVPIRTRAKGKLLRPGSYMLSATLRTADGRASAPATLRFKVLPR